jgi:bifunctional UDP-N-acetylglucosamine pyrophosphorylase/glucosamine-1-phosphate N-acetyltransferase
MDLVTLVMAAGKGKRMQNPDKSKVMHDIGGKPMIEYVITLALGVGSSLIVPIVGHQKQSVMDFLRKRFSNDESKIKFAHQDEQLGTGHAVMMTEQIASGIKGNVLILSGDVPLLSLETVQNFKQFHETGNYDASLISAVLDDPSGYGRVLRDSHGTFFDIREDKDCTEEERKCREINSGIYIIDNALLFEALKTLKTDNAQGEYYLTDVFKHFRSKGKRIGAFITDNVAEISGINTIEQLQTLEREYFS